MISQKFRVLISFLCQTLSFTSLCAQNAVEFPTEDLANDDDVVLEAPSFHLPPPPADLLAPASPVAEVIPHLDLKKGPSPWSSTLGLSFLPYDALYKPMVLEASFSYQLAPRWNFEFLKFGWAFWKYSTGLRGRVYNDLQRELTGAPNVDVNSLQVLQGDEMKKLLMFSGSSVYFKAFEGEMRMSATKKFKHDWHFGVGGTYFYMRSVHQAGVDLGTRINFHMNERAHIQVRANQIVGVTSDRQNSIGIFGLAMGYRF